MRRVYSHKWTCISMQSRDLGKGHKKRELSIKPPHSFLLYNWLKSIRNPPEGYTKLCLFKIVLFSMATVCYALSYRGEFVFDDKEAIVNNGDVHFTFVHAKRVQIGAVSFEERRRKEEGVNNEGYWSLINNDFWGTPLRSNISHKSWRPFTTFTFGLNYAWSKFDTRSYHIVNILLHSLITLLTHRFFRAILIECNNANAMAISNLASILFAVHPIHTECVASIVGRAELLSALFFLSSFLLYDAGCKNNGFTRIWISVGFAFMAMLSKEQGITVLALCIMYDILVVSKAALRRFFENLEHRKNDVCNNNTEKRISLNEPELSAFIKRICILISSSMAILCIRFYAMGFTVPKFNAVDNPASFYPNILIRFINYNYIYALNAWLLLNPSLLCFDYSMGCIPLIIGWNDYRLSIVLIFWIATAYLVYQAWSQGNEHRMIFQMSLSIIGITFFPVSNIPFRVGFVLAERVLYLPSLGYCMLVGMALEKVGRRLRDYKKTLYNILITSTVIVFMAKSMHRSQEWTSESRLFSSGVTVCPGNAKVHYNLGIVLANHGRRDHAEIAYKNALQLNPEYDHAMNNLGNLLKDLHRFEEAEIMLENAVRIRPDFAAAWMNLGIVQATLRKFEASEKSYLTGLRLRRHFPDCFFNLGNLYIEQGKYSDALQAWLNATDQNPSHAKAWINIMILLDNLDQCDLAIEYGSSALPKITHDAGFHFTLANCMGKLEKFQESHEHFQMAIRLDPKNPTYWANLGVLLHRWKKYEEAENAYKKAMALDANSESIMKNYQLLQKAMRK